MEHFREDLSGGPGGLRRHRPGPRRRPPGLGGRGPHRLRRHPSRARPRLRRNLRRRPLRLPGGHAGRRAPGLPPHLHPPLPPHPHGPPGRGTSHPRVHRATPGDGSCPVGGLPSPGARPRPGGRVLPEPLQRQCPAAPPPAGFRPARQAPGGPCLRHLEAGGPLLHRERLAGQPGDRGGRGAHQPVHPHPGPAGAVPGQGPPTQRPP